MFNIRFRADGPPSRARILARASVARFALAFAAALVLCAATGTGARATVVIGGNGVTTVDNVPGSLGGGCACGAGLLGSPVQEPPRVGWPPSLRTRTARGVFHRERRAVARRAGRPRTLMAEARTAAEPQAPAPEAERAESPRFEAPTAETPDHANRTMGDLIEGLPPPPSASETPAPEPERRPRRARTAESAREETARPAPEPAEPAPEVELPTLAPAPQPEHAARAPEAERPQPAKQAAQPTARPTARQPSPARNAERPAKPSDQRKPSNRVAALTPPSEPAETHNAYSALSLAFGAGSDALSAQGNQALTHFAARFANTPDRIEILAYAAAAGDDFGAARRLSLKRALAVRSVLMKEGIRSTRIDVRALGGSQSGGDPDRVDLTIERPNGSRPPNGGPESGG